MTNDDGAVAEPVQRWDWSRIDSESWLTGRRLLDLSPRVRASAERWWTGTVTRSAWESWIAEVEHGWETHEGESAGWSQIERNLFELVAGVVTDRPFRIGSVLGYTGSQEAELWAILTDWGTGGNNRDEPGRATVVSRTNPAPR